MTSFLDSDDCARVLKAMADPTRLRILRALASRPRSVGEVVRALGIDQPKASHHLAVLRQAGLVLDARDGRRVSYRLHPAVSHQLRAGDGLIELGCCSVELRSEDAPPE